MKRVTIVQSFDGHAIGSVVELSDSAAESAMIQRRATIMPEDNTPASKPVMADTASKPKPKRKAPAKKKT